MSDTTYYSGSGNPTTLEAVLTQNTAAITDYVKQWNEEAKANYLNNVFAPFATGVTMGLKKPEDAPKPPMAWEVGYASYDPTIGAKWAYPVVGSTPVCDMPAIPAPPPAPAPPIQVPADVMNVPVGDVLPIGFILTAPDGSRWQKQATPSPFGTHLFYQRIS